MSDDVATRPRKAGLVRAPVWGALALYCLALFLLFDFAWSSLTRGEETSRAARIADPVYDHGFSAKFEGYDVWGELRYPLITNSLGFKDASPRDVPQKSSSRRVLLIGDSFTEGIGMRFEDSFAGRLQQAGEGRVEFLNAGVASYSPSIYYRKIKYLLESGLQFDEVVLFSDPSDVTDEATSYFCIDEDPRYRIYCTASEGSMQPDMRPKKSEFFIDRFVITNRVRISLKRWIQSLLGNRKRALATDRGRIGWSISGFDASGETRPLGVEGGVARSLQNMGKLADLLAAHNLPLTIVVYPWAQQIAQGERDSRQVALWRQFCERRCKAFINLFPVLFAEAEHDGNWYERLYIVGDDHFSAEGNAVVAREMAKRLH